MSHVNEDHEPFDEVAESFLERYRAGERPSVSEYAQRFPMLADQIRELLPALVALEKAKPKPEERRPTGPSIPDRLGGYRILRKIGQGGMGVVYEAEQEALGRHVALKVLPFARLLDPTYRERFQREAQAAARLHHSNIVPVFGVGEEDGLHYYAMQHIKGQGLDQVLREIKASRAVQSRPVASDQRETQLTEIVADDIPSGTFAAPPFLSDDDGLADAEETIVAISRPSALVGKSKPDYYQAVARLGMQAAEALAYAHQHGILHRDIKPSNLLLDSEGTVWITDFGLAKVEGSSDLTRPGEVVGTLCYMAPEQFKGVSDRRCDVYGLGMTLYELLALRPAFEDSDRARLITRMNCEEPPALHKWDARVPRDLETIVLKAIAHEAAHRYQTAGELAEDLRRFLAHQPILARRSTLAERAGRWCRRNPLVAGLSGVVVVLLLVLAFGLGVTSLLRRERDKALEAQARAERAEREVAILSHLWRATALRRNGAGGQRFKCLDEIGQALRLEPPEDLRGQLRVEAVGALALPDLYLAKQWEGFPPGTEGVDFADGIETYARTDQSGNCSIRQVADDREIVLLPGWGKPAMPYLSGDGRFVALIGRGGRCRLWKVDASKPKLLIEDKVHPVANVVFRHDSRWIAIAYRDGRINVRDLATDELLYQLEPDEPKTELGLALHPTEPILAVASYFNQRLQIRSLLTGEVRAEVRDDGGFVGVDWSPNGEVLAAGGGNTQNIYFYDRQLNPLNVRPTTSGGLRVCFNHSGDRLVSVGWSGNVQLWDVAAGRLLFTLPGSLGVPGLRFSRDDQWMAGVVSGNQLGIWRVGAGRDMRTLVRSDFPSAGSYFSAAVGGGGDLLAVAMDGGVGFWNLNTGAELGFLPRPNVVPQILFEPSGTLLTLEETSGVFRWALPAQWAPADIIELEPIEKLPFPIGGYAIAQSRDGRVLAMSVRNIIGVGAWGGIWVHHSDRPQSPLHIETDAAHLAVSPDGRWIVTAKHLDDTLNVWEAKSGRLVRQIKQGTGVGFCDFSADGKWLATGVDGNRLWRVDVEPWTEGPRLPSANAVNPLFSPDGKWIAHDTNAGTVRLIDAVSLREIFQLPDPHLNRAIPVFTPDGTRLITLSNGTVAGVHIWDLRSLRQELVALGFESN
ncbi:MAG TPA: serine/threonine-protein kinase [Pirellulales bacterium]|nr:serine/threonine-protein kinase [Pirellulales bacterium]